MQMRCRFPERMGPMAAVSRTSSECTLPVQEGAVAGNRSQSPSRVAVTTVEIRRGLGRACEVASSELGMEGFVLRARWNDNIVNLGSKQLVGVQRILTRCELRLAGIANPFFKVDREGAPLSRCSTARDVRPDFMRDQRDEVL